MPKLNKPFTEYVFPEDSDGIKNYFQKPTSEFIFEILHISDAFSLCLRRFPKKKNGDFTQSSLSSHFQLSAGCLCTIMGHFELYQRFMFAGLIEHSVHLHGFDFKDAVRRLKSEFQFEIDPSQLLAYRSEGAAVGQIFVDNLPGWHNPTRVNSYFRAIRPKHTFYSNDQTEDLSILWQLRHSVAHTGGWLSIPDAQKIPKLSQMQNKALFFEPHFIEAVVRRFHKIAPDCTNRLKLAFDHDVSPQFAASDTYKNFFDVSSSRKSWL